MKDLRTTVLAVGALGVVYGDIGTNPLFAMRDAFEARTTSGSAGERPRVCCR